MQLQDSLASQVADLNRGAFGFVQLAKDLETGEQVAIKFIERGDKARMRSIALATSPSPAPAVLPAWHGWHTPSPARYCKQYWRMPACLCRSASTWSARS